jgi:hypothetical protein
MRHLETVKGEGQVIAPAGGTKVRYELNVYQNEINVGSTTNPSAKIGGLKDIRGWVRPVCGSLGEMLKLEMADGTSVNFMFEDRKGSIRCSGGITSPQKA